MDEFTGEDPDCTLDDWLPSLERAGTGIAWTEEERIIQLAGHLKLRALQEWNLLEPGERASYSRAVEALRSRLDYGNKASAAQDFRHSAQREAETVADFVRRLEHTFRTAYGRDRMSSETKDMLLYGQLQEGMHLQLMKAPAVSGAKNYQELIIAARNEEKRLADLQKRQAYARSIVPTSQLKQESKRPSELSQATKPRYPHNQDTS